MESGGIDGDVPDAGRGGADLLCCCKGRERDGVTTGDDRPANRVAAGRVIDGPGKVAREAAAEIENRVRGKEHFQ